MQMDLDIVINRRRTPGCGEIRDEDGGAFLRRVYFPDLGFFEKVARAPQSSGVLTVLRHATGVK
jgi:hypothetical protein